jgi:DNA processing protein
LNIKEMIFVLYDLGISNSTLSFLYREMSEEQISLLLSGDYLELQFMYGIFEDKELLLISSPDKIKKSKSYIADLINHFHKNNIEYYLYFEDGYPESLKGIPSPPFIIFMKGNKKLLQGSYICSIVGTREPSEQTLLDIENTVQMLVKEKVVIASGLALGTDIQAHKATLDQKGKTIAVLPSSVNNVLPKSHKNYAKKILETDGLLISEYYKKESKINRTNYIHRNRIISGISNAVIIAECTEKSGTMHTARFAYKQNRPILCFNNNSSGVMKLISTHSANYFTGIHDII